MGSMTLEQLVANVLGLPADQVTDATSPETVAAWDSVRHLQIVIALEKAYAIRFSLPESLQLNSVAAARALLTRKGATP